MTRRSTSSVLCAKKLLTLIHLMGNLSAYQRWVLAHRVVSRIHICFILLIPGKTAVEAPNNRNHHIDCCYTRLILP